MIYQDRDLQNVLKYITYLKQTCEPISNIYIQTTDENALAAAFFIFWCGMQMTCILMSYNSFVASKDFSVACAGDLQQWEWSAFEFNMNVCRW